MKRYPQVTRIELIKNGKRTFVSYDATEVFIDLQDSEKTLKIFFKVK